MSRPVYKEGEVSQNGMTIENTLNKADGSLPFGLFNPQLEGKLTWICGISQEHKIVGVFNMDLGDRSERETREYTDQAEAEVVRDGLKTSGWQILVPPRIEFTVDGDRPLNRKERRELSKKIKEMQKDHDAF